MTDLETKLAEERERLREEMKANNPGIESFSRLILWGEGFDACAAIVREVVAEKDKQLLDMSAYTAEFNVYREQLVQMTKELAEKDAEIARLRSGLDTLGKTVGEGAEVVGRCSSTSPTAPEQSHKVTDAQLEQIKMAIKIITNCQRHQAAIATNAVRQIIEESTDEPAAK